jgi:hypothetical protein
VDGYHADADAEQCAIGQGKGEHLCPMQFDLADRVIEQ